MNLKGRVYPPAPFPAVPLAPPAPDDTAALRGEALRQAQDTIARLRAENAGYLRTIALLKEIAMAEHGQVAARLVHAEHKCGMLRFLLFSAWVKLGEAVKKP